MFQPVEGVYVAAADYSFYNFRQYSHTDQRHESVLVKKSLDLSVIPASVWSKAQLARVDVFMYTEGAEEGAFQITVNGNVNTFPTKGLASSGWGWYGCQLAHNWFGFAIDKDQLTRGENEIILGLAGGGKSDGTRMSVGIDMFKRRGCSRISHDGGSTWKTSPLNKYDFSGEYMIRLSLFESKDDADHQGLFSHEDFPSLPRVELMPRVKKLTEPVWDEPVALILSDTEQVYENKWMKVAVESTNGLKIAQLVHKSVGGDVLAPESKQGIFVVEVNGAKLTGEDFDVLKTAVLSKQQDKVVVVYDVAHQGTQLSGRVRFTITHGPELQIGLSFRNTAAHEQKVNVAFPVLGQITWSQDPQEDYYLYPYLYCPI